MEEKSRSSPPSVGDFSREASRKAVLRKVSFGNLTLYPTTLGMLGLLAGALIDPMLYFLALGGVGVGLGNWIVGYFFRGDSIEREYIEELRIKMEQHKKKVMENVKNELNRCQAIEGGEQFAEQGFEQFIRIQEKFGNLKHILSEKLYDGELTYGRYYGTAEQVFLSVLDNLQDIVNILKSVSTIDVRYIEKRKKELKKLKAVDKADEEEMATLEKREAIRNKQLQKVNMLLTKNEESMTSLDEITTAIAEVKMTQGYAKLDMETARQRLEELAKNAHEYSV